jgi:glucose-6-phosphate dehydrogenase assembly protein OpcA
LLPDSPVVVWWPRKAPLDPAADPLGELAQRRITDAAATERGRTHAIMTQARCYAAGNTDLSWTRLTPWRALLAAALDQYPAKVTSGTVEAERINPSADLLVAWLTDCLHVPITRAISKGPGITSVSLNTGGGPIEIARTDGLLAEFTIPNAPNRPVALKRRDTAELLAEELRRLDPDDVYEATVKRLCQLADAPAPKDGRKKAAAEKASSPKAAKASASSAVLAKRSSPSRRTGGGTQAKKASPRKKAAKRSR